MSAVASDSLVRILTEAKKIQCSEITFCNDTVQYGEKVVLKGQDAGILQYLLLDEAMNCPAPKNIFAKFFPIVKADFEANGKSVSALFDLGLSQWTLSDATGKVTEIGKIPDRRFLRFFHIVFPDSETITTLYDLKPENK